MMQRIMIIGGPGSGKSTLARALGAHLELPVTHIDRYQFKPGWHDEAPEIRDAKVRESVAEPRWIIDGNYSSTIPDRMARADTLIWLDMPFWLRLWRIVKRTLRHYGRSRADLAEGCPERFSLEFFHYVVTTRKSQRVKSLGYFRQMAQERNAIHLRNTQEVRQFLARLSSAR